MGEESLLAFAVFLGAALAYWLLFRRYVGGGAPLFVLSLAVAWVFLLLSRLYWSYPAILEAGRWILMVAVAAITAWAAARAGRKVALGPSVVFTAMVVVFLFVTAVWSIAADLTIQRAVTIAFLWCAVGGVVWYAGHAEEDIERTLKAIVLPPTLVFWGLVPIFGFDLSLMERGIWRTAGPMINPNGIAGVSVLLALPAFYLWRRPGPGRALWFLSFVTFVGMIVLSGTRGALGALVIAGTFYMVARMRTRAAGIVVVALVVLTGYLLSEVVGVQEGFTEYIRPEELATASGRFEAWSAASEFLDQRVWLGFGFGTEDLLFGLFEVVFSIHQGNYVHNSYLGLAVQVGVVAAAAIILWMLGTTFAAVVVGMRERDPMLLALTGTAIAGLTLGMTESWFYSAGNGLALPFWLMFGLLLRRLGDARRWVSAEVTA